MRKYLEIFKFNLKTELNFKVDYFFSLLSFAVHIFVFNALWDFILQDKAILGYTKSQLIWYIIVGEFIAYSIGKKNYLKVSDMIKNGDVANLLTKPVSFIKYIFAQEATSIINIVVNFLFGIIFGLIMAGSIELTLLQVLFFIISIIISLLIALFVQILIGMLAFITEENQSFYLIISKAMLLLIFTPLEFFPQVVQTILKFLPTTYIIYAPGKILVDFDFNVALTLIISQVISFVFVYICVYALNRKGVKNINVNGG
mgnify:FL=1